MKRTVLVTCMIAGLYSNAFADLGDTYSVSKHRYGLANRTEDNITWWAPKTANKTWIGATFYRDQCVCISYVPAEGQSISESEIWRLLKVNSRPGAIWSEYQRSSSDAQYVNQDNTLHGKFNFSSGVLTICYTSHLQRQGLLPPRSAANNHKSKDKGSPLKLDGLDTFNGELGIDPQ